MQAYRQGQNQDRRLQELQQQVLKYQEAIERISQAPMQLSSLVRVHQSGSRYYVTVTNAIGTLCDVLVSEKLAAELRAGDSVWQAANGGVIGRAPAVENLGVSATVRQVFGNSVEIDGPSGARVVAYSPDRHPAVRVGATVLIDRGGCVVVGQIRGQQASEYLFEAETGVSFDDIAGLEEAKQTLREAVELPLLHPELYRAYGKKPLRGVLLEGPPRVGKTMLAKAVATSLRSQGGPGGFFYLKGPAVLDKYIGVAESRVRAVFAAAREFMREHGRPAVIFLDEAEALLSARGSSPYAHVEQTMVPQFLSEMDGLEQSGALVLLATNRASQLDPAVTGHGRVDRTVYVPRPTETVVAKILELALGRALLAEGQVADVARELARDVFHDTHVVQEVVRGKLVLRLRDVVNGAMPWALVDIASSLALARDLQEGSKPSGVTQADLQLALRTLVEQERHKNHRDEVQALAAPLLAAAKQEEAPVREYTEQELRALTKARR